MIRRGKLFIFEGLDLSGKSTCAKAIVPWLNEQGKPAIYVKAPGQTPMGQVLRQMVIDQKVTGTTSIGYTSGVQGTLGMKYEIPTPIRDQLAIELLHLADLRETATQVILPALEAGTHVICDRFHNSTRAYAAAHKVYAGWIEQQIEWVIPQWLREQTTNILFKISVETFAERRQQYGTQDPLDNYALQFYRDVAHMYDSLVYRKVQEMYNPDRLLEHWLIVDAESPQEEVLTWVQSQIITSLWTGQLGRTAAGEVYRA
jgi:dTMP kinase